MRNLYSTLIASVLFTIAALSAHAQKFPDGIMPLRGQITAVTKDSVTLATKEGTSTVKLDATMKQYKRMPSDLSKISDKTFVGVTSVNTAGKEKATEVHIFPSELTGLGEGSYMMEDMGGGTKPKSRMSNGAVKMGRMTNGSVAKNKDSNLTVTFDGGEKVISIPKDVPVTMITAVPTTLKVGDKVFVLAKKATDGTLTADKVITAE